MVDVHTSGYESEDVIELYHTHSYIASFHFQINFRDVIVTSITISEAIDVAIYNDSTGSAILMRMMIPPPLDVVANLSAFSTPKYLISDRNQAHSLEWNLPSKSGWNAK
ncbi:hypothetical protein TNCV_3279561 [Trichonephila clavipes]|nr:hypothetical protein TNCV_3279561 [Trichonephila clavipes]